MMRLLMTIPVVLLAACGSEPTPVPPKPQGMSEFQQKIVAMDNPTLKIVLIRAIRDADVDCQGVTKSERRPDLPTGELYYAATCTDGSMHGVTFQREGTARIISRS